MRRTEHQGHKKGTHTLVENTRCVRKVKIQRSSTWTTFLIYKSDTVNEVPVHNFIFQHSRPHCPNIY